MPSVQEQTQGNRIDVAGAVRAAKAYAERVLNSSEVTLEEVGRTEDGRYWSITLGHAQRRILPDPVDPLHAALALPQSAPPRYDMAYKIFRVDAETGEVVDMKMRAIP